MEEGILKNLISGSSMKRIPAYIILWVLVIHIGTEDALAQPVNDSVMLNSILFREKLHLFTDRSLYTAGETVYFRIYNLSQELLKENNWSLVVYLELLNGENRPVAQGKYHLDRGGSQGQIQIPDTVSTGLYTIRSYTRWMRNFPASEYCHLPLVIVNPEKIKKIDQSATYSETKYSSISKKEAGIVCTPDKIKYGKREKVTVKINAGNSPPSKEGYCISVIRKGYLDEEFNGFPGSVETERVTLKDPFYYPETRGISVTGVLVGKQDGQPAGSSWMAMTLLGSDPDFFEFGSDEKGRVNFSLPHHSGNVDALITFYDNGKERKELQLDSEFSTDYLKTTPFTVDFFRDRRDLVGDALVTSQLRKAFERTAGDSIIAEEENPPHNFYGKPEFRYLSGDYVELPNLEEFFFEIIQQVQVKSDHDGKHLVVMDDQGMNLDYPPLILLDHVPVPEIENILTVSPSQLDYIDVINRVYIRGNNVYGGIVSIKSKGRDRAGIGLPAGSIFINYSTFYKLREPVFPDYQEVDKADRIPDLRTTLYWSANSSIISGKEDSITFYTSDSSGDYEVIVRGISAGGKIVQGHCEFKVE
jgi:hypothetical protein